MITLAQLEEMTPTEYDNIFYQEQVNELYNNVSINDEEFIQMYHDILVTYISGYQIGEIVRWNDPCIDEYEGDKEEALNRRFEVIDVIDYDIFRISDSYTDAEVYSRELERFS